MLSQWVDKYAAQEYWAGCKKYQTGSTQQPLAKHVTDKGGHNSQPNRIDFEPQIRWRDARQLSRGYLATICAVYVVWFMKRRPGRLERLVQMSSSLFWQFALGQSRPI